MDKAWKARYPDKYKAQRRRYDLKKRYGLTVEQFDSLYLAQRGLCAGCGRGFNWAGRKLCVDHDHITKKVRGLLCGGCNRAIGFAEDSPERLRALARYLDEQGSGEGAKG